MPNVLNFGSYPQELQKVDGLENVRRQKVMRGRSQQLGRAPDRILLIVKKYY